MAAPRKYPDELRERRTPAGVYQASIQVNGVETRVRLAVQSDGAQVGMANTGGVRTPAPPLDLGDLSFMLNGAEHRAERV
jgi:hypothetical protein